MVDRNEIVLSTHDAATLAAVLATVSPHRAPLPGAAEELTELLDRATLVPSDAPLREVVGLDSEITYLELPAGRSRTVRLVHPAAADASAARVSLFAPVARALLGRRAGMRVPVALPDASIDALHVISVLPPRRAA